VQTAPWQNLPELVAAEPVHGEDIVNASANLKLLSKTMIFIGFYTKMAATKKNGASV
jgi:hypothetical protein